MGLAVVQYGAVKSFNRSPQRCEDVIVMICRVIPHLLLTGIMVTTNLIIPLYGGGVLIALPAIFPYIYWFKRFFYPGPNSSRANVTINGRTVSEILQELDNENRENQGSADRPRESLSNSDELPKERIDHVFQSQAIPISSTDVVG